MYGYHNEQVGIMIRSVERLTVVPLLVVESTFGLTYMLLRHKSQDTVASATVT